MYINYRDIVFNIDDGTKALVSFGIQGFKEKSSKQGSNITTLDCMEYGIPYFINSCGVTPKNVTENAKITSNEYGFECSYAYDRDLNVTSSVEFIDGFNLVRQKNTVVNNSSENSTLTHISSAHIAGLDNFGALNWNDDGKFKIHYCKSRWCGEAHWCEKTPHELDIYPATDGNAGYSGAIQFTSKGSWTTSRYYPMVVIEDIECGVCYCLELENIADWTIEIGYMCTYDGGKFYIEANGADFENTGWKYELAPGGKYETPSVVYGCIKGDFESAIREMIKFKRSENLAPWKNNIPYLCFNDFMNCLMGRATDKNSIPLIDAAAKAGVELYCMDAGWYAEPVDGNIAGDWDRRIGTWIPNDELYGKYGLKGIIDYIKSKGMIPGIWTELECFMEGTPLYNEGLYLKDANGAPLCGAGKRFFADMTNPKVLKYLEGAIDRLYQMGVRYIKNDYNASTRLGACIDGEGGSESNRILLDATKRFFKSIRDKYPDLMIENCGSGAMRSDNSILKLFNIQSTSDEERYYLNPSVAAGSAAILPPEKAGNWAYPYPCFSDTNKQKFKFGSPEYFESMADGEETVFNMINGLCGVMYMSGRIDVADEYNFSLIKEGAEVYKKFRSHLVSSYPVYPSGKVQRNFKNTSFGLISEDNKRLMLAVWRLSEKENSIEIDLGKYGDIKNIELVYPHNKPGVTYLQRGNTLTVEFDKNFMARYFEISF